MTAGPSYAPTEQKTTQRAPHGLELEDLVASHLIQAGLFVETNIKLKADCALQKTEPEVGELDVVSTDYTTSVPRLTAYEVKSGSWRATDVFALLGRAAFLGIQASRFVHTEENLPPQSISWLSRCSVLQMIFLPSPSDWDLTHALLSGRPSTSSLPAKLWWRSAAIQRLVLGGLKTGIDSGTASETCKACKQHHRLVNDTTFTEPSLPERVKRLMAEHERHRTLAASVAHEKGTGSVSYEDLPPQCPTFRDALYYGHHPEVQAALYVDHRARLVLLKSLVDLQLTRRSMASAGVSPATTTSIDGDLVEAKLSILRTLGGNVPIERLPAFWQVFLWSWGGFLLENDLRWEMERLGTETGLTPGQVEVALRAFDKLFPTGDKGWFRTPRGSSRRLMMLMPVALRGVGAARRRFYWLTEGRPEPNAATLKHLEEDLGAAAKLYRTLNRAND